MKPTVRIYRHTLGKLSEPFVTDHARFFTRIDATFLCRECLNPGIPSTAFLVRATRIQRALHAITATPRYALQAIATQQPPSLIHAHFAFDGLYAMRLAKSAGIPLVVTLHGVDVSANSRALLASRKPSWVRLAFSKRQLGRQAVAFICVSDHIAKLAAYAYPATKLHRIYLGVDLKQFSYQPPHNALNILHIARFVEKKGTIYLIEALGRLKGPLKQTTLTVVGDGPLKPAIESRIVALGLGSRVTIVPRASRDEIRMLMHAHRIFCLPSITAANGDTEGLPISLLEAMASGPAIVATSHAGIPEAVTPDCGVLVPERDIDSLTSALEVMLGDYPFAHARSIRARMRVEEHFDMVRCARSTEDLLMTFIAGM